MHGKLAVAAALIMLATAAPAQASPLVISEVRAGDLGEFVEVFNTSEADVALDGWTLELGAGFCGSPMTSHAFPDATLPPGGHLLIGSQAFEASSDVPPDTWWGAESLNVDGSWVRIFAPSEFVTPADAVAWGDSGSCGEGSSAPSPPAGTSIARRGGWQDTGDNAADFESVAVPGPQNQAAALTPKVLPPAPVVEEEPAAASTSGSQDEPAPADPPAGPTVENVEFAAPPVAGTPAILTISSIDALAPVTGVSVVYGTDNLGLSACQRPAIDQPFRANTPQAWNLPLTFASAGTYTVTVGVTADGCSLLPRTTVETLEVVVGAAPKKTKKKPKGKASARKRGRCAKDLVTSARTKRAAANAILCLMNAERRKAGLRTLRPSRKLLKIAVGHNKDMLERRFFLHEHPAGPTLLDRMVKGKYVGFMGENLAYFSAATAGQAMAAWMASPPHKANILQPKFRWAGVAVAMGSPKVAGPPNVTMTVNFGDKRK